MSRSSVVVVSRRRQTVIHSASCALFISPPASRPDDFSVLSNHQHYPPSLPPPSPYVYYLVHWLPTPLSESENCAWQQVLYRSVGCELFVIELPVLGNWKFRCLCLLVWCKAALFSFGTIINQQLLISKWLHGELHVACKTHVTAGKLEREAQMKIYSHYGYIWSRLWKSSLYNMD